MKNYFIAAVLIIINSCPLTAQLNLNWQSIIDDGNNGNEVSSVSVNDPNGYVYTIGTKRPWGFNTSDLVLVKYDASGNELWRTFYSGPAGRNEFIYGGAIDQNGDLLLCGEIFNASNKNDILVMKYSSIGGFMWMDTIDGSAALYDQGLSVCVDDANNYYFSGYASSGVLNGILLKYSSSGQRIWNRSYANTQQALEVSYYEGHLYMNCMTSSTGNPSHAAILKLDTAGTVLNTVNLNSNYGDNLAKVRLDAGRIYLLDKFTNSAPLGSQFSVTCLDTSMQLVWSKSYVSGYLSNPVGIDVHDTILYVAHSEYQNSSYSVSYIRLRGISAITGDSLFMMTAATPAGQLDLAIEQCINVNGVVSVFGTYEIAPSVKRYLLMQFDPSGTMMSSYPFYDVVGFGDYSMFQTSPTSVVISATVSDSVAFNTNISTWKFSNLATGLSAPAINDYPTAGPVPIRGFIELFALPESLYYYDVFTLSGQKVQEGILQNGDRRIALNVDPGFYFLKLYNGNCGYTIKFISE